MIQLSLQPPDRRLGTSKGDGQEAAVRLPEGHCTAKASSTHRRRESRPLKSLPKIAPAPSCRRLPRCITVYELYLYVSF